MKKKAKKNPKKAKKQDIEDYFDGKSLIKYAWPGGYPLFYIDGSNNVLCPKCATKALLDDDVDDSEKIAGADVNWENPRLYCDACPKRIESAYAEDDA